MPHTNNIAAVIKHTLSLDASFSKKQKKKISNSKTQTVALANTHKQSN